MEKRFVSFLLLAMAVLLLHWVLMDKFGPKRQPPQQQPEEQEQAERPAPGAEPGEDQAEPTPPPPGEETPAPPPAEPKEKEEPEAAQQWVTLGSVDPQSPFRMGVTFNNRGASIERIELSSPRYHDLNDRKGYLGHLALTLPKQGSGGLVNAVVGGTPAAKAGLQVGDVIEAIDQQPMLLPEDILRYVGGDHPGYIDSNGGKMPGEEIILTVRRPGADGTLQRKTLTAKLTDRPLEVVRPEPLDPQLGEPRHPLSFLMTLDSLGEQKVPVGEEEIPGLRSLYESRWEPTVHAEGNEPWVEFRLRLGPAALKRIGIEGELEIVKRYRLVGGEKSVEEDPNAKAYHLQFELEIHNVGPRPQTLAYRLDGPTGLPLEGWWYSYKVHPTKFSSVGARDVIYRSTGSYHKLIALPSMVDRKQDEPDSPGVSLFKPEEGGRFDYAGVDAQYFLAALLTEKEGKPADGKAYDFANAYGHVVGPIPEGKGREERTTDVSFQLISQRQPIEAGGVLKRQFLIFAGPKQPTVLDHYGLGDSIVYGWFGAVSKPLLGLLHFFYQIIGNYGIAIILLTFLVRGIMTPLGRKQALNAQKMQELAPAMKEIAEKYKNDMEKRAKAQQELFRKNKYNPLAGCWLMFLQLPIFIGLYRGLSVDIELRQAGLIPGISWCSNLAGPDMLFYWGDRLWPFLTSPTGWLGPFFNILPIFSIVMFMVHQKMFMPPPTDEQQKMQQSVMKFMTIFIGVLFFKVASGLCLYLITSSLWGLIERLLLPRPKTPAVVKPADADDEPAAPKTYSSTIKKKKKKR